MFTKGCSGFVLYLDLELFVNIKKIAAFYTLRETRFSNNLRSKQNPEQSFVDIGK